MLFLARMDLKLPLSIMATHVATGALAAFKQL
jgi:muconolactone delta-isomerase